jgi:hypothetical protein
MAHGVMFPRQCCLKLARKLALQGIFVFRPRVRRASFGCSEIVLFVDPVEEINQSVG